MPRFFFDVLEYGEVTPDNGGLQFDSPNAAEHEAARCAAEIRRDKFPKGHTREVTVHFRSEDGNQDLSAAVPMTARRLEFAQA